MQDYAADGVQMFPTSDEPSGYDLHSVRIKRLAIRAIAEIEVDNDDDKDAVNESSLQAQDAPGCEPKSAIERGNEAARHIRPKTVQVVKEPTYLDMKKQQVATQMAKERGDDHDADVGAEETDSDDLDFLEYCCIDVE